MITHKNSNNNVRVVRKTLNLSTLKKTAHEKVVGRGDIWLLKNFIMIL